MIPDALASRVDRFEGFWHGLASIDDDGLARDVSGFLRREKQGRVADVLDRAEPFHGDRCCHGIPIVLAEPGQALGDDIAGQDRVDGDAVARKLDAGGTHEAELTSLARAVVTPAREAGYRSRDRGSE